MLASPSGYMNVILKLRSKVIKFIVPKPRDQGLSLYRDRSLNPARPYQKDGAVIEKHKFDMTMYEERLSLL